MRKAYLKCPLTHTQHLNCAQKLFGNGPIGIDQKHTERCLMEMSDQSSANTARLNMMAKRAKILVHENERILIVAVLYD